jgi:hypothetical protein
MPYFTCRNCGGAIESPMMPAFQGDSYTQCEEISANCYRCNIKYVRYYPENATAQDTVVEILPVSRTEGTE